MSVPIQAKARSASPASATTAAAACSRVASGTTQSPGAGEPMPSHVSRVRRRWRSWRWVSGMATETTSQRPSHGATSRWKE